MASDAAPVVVGVDGSRGALDAARWACAIADRLGVPLRVITAMPALGYNPSDIAVAVRVAAIEEHRTWADRYLEAAADVVRADHPGVQVTTASLAEPADEALGTASRSARLVVLGCEDVTATGALLVGSTTLRALAHASCPVVAWRGGAIAPSTQPIVAGVDGSGRDGGALHLAFELAEGLDVPLWVVHSWKLKGYAQFHRPAVVDADADTQRQSQRIDELIGAQRTNHPSVNVTAQIGESAKASHALALHGECAQLVVVGSRRRHPLARGLFGSTSLNLLHHCRVPVVLCPFEEHDPAYQD
ncbi:MAG: universal stress protein [Mycobacterium sp.]